jgi:hypothetical protein
LYGGEWFQAQLAAGYSVSEETRRKAANGVKELPPVPVEMSDVGASIELVVKKMVHRKKVVPEVPAVVEPAEKPAETPAEKPAEKPAQKKQQSKKVVKAAPVVDPVVPEPPKKVRVKKVPKKTVEEPDRMVPPQATMLHTTSGFLPRDTVPRDPVPRDTVPKPKRQSKKVVAKTTPIIGIVAPTPLEDPTVVKIAVKKVVIDGRDLYVSEQKDKVFDLKFQYLGRWNRKEDRIDTTYPDSDADTAMC